MTALEKYLAAVETRKAIDKNGRVNVAILKQLEGVDIPLLVSIIREYDKVVKLKEVEALAAKGDCSRWGA